MWPPKTLMPYLGRVLVDGRKSYAQQDARSHEERVSALLLLAAWPSSATAAKNMHRPSAHMVAQIVVCIPIFC
jgi:hypothetical protein